MTIRPTTQPARWIVRYDGAIALEGTTRPGEVTVSGHELIGAEGENAALAAFAPYASEFDPLPGSGWLEAGDLYRDGECVVMVRQSHARTEHAVDDLVPTLFLVYRPDAGDVLEWVAGESVLVGTLRTYEGDTYRCIQSHVTQADWTPDATPALWTAAVGELAGEEWQPWTAYAIDGVVSYDGTLYKCCQAHTSQPGWEPPNVPALWETI